MIWRGIFLREGWQCLPAGRQGALFGLVFFKNKPKKAGMNSLPAGRQARHEVVRRDERAI